MDIVMIVRGMLVVGVFLIIIFLIRIIRMMMLEKRISSYTLATDNIDRSLFDQLQYNYNHFISKFSRSKYLKRYAISYNKKGIVSNDNAVIFIINKLCIGFLFVLLIVISINIRGKTVGIVGLIFSFVIGYYLYDIYIIWYNKNRRKRIKNDMLRAVIIMNNAFKAGKSTLQAVKIASNDLPKYIGEEFDKIYQDMNYGLSVDVAFSRFATRVGLEEANYIATSLTILNKTGGNIVQVFSSIERTLFDKKKLESDLKNSTAASSLVVKVLMVIPVLFVMVIYVISPSYFAPLFQSTLGYMVVGVIVIMFSIYIYLLNKIMKVKV